MKKNFLQDVIPANQKRSIRDVPLPTRSKTKTVSEQKVLMHHKKEKSFETDSDTIDEQKTEHTSSKKTHSVSESQNLHKDTEESSNTSDDNLFASKEFQIPTYKKSKKILMKKIILTGTIVGITLFLGFVFMRTEAVVTITPQTASKEISLVVPLDTTNQLATKTQISQTLSKTLVATGEQQVEKQSSGKIKISNLHKEVPQELVKNTRFQTPTGLIYRIKNSIVIPGYTMNGSTIVPGTLEVEVFADSAGEEYNISNTKFTIPGFSGKEQFEKITAETVGQISGGYIGIRKIVSDDEKEKVQKEFEDQLKLKIEQTQNESTEYILVPDVTTLTYGELQDKVEGDSVVLTLSATVDAYSFVKKELFNFIGQNTVDGTTTKDQFDIDSSTLTFLVDKDTIKINGSTLITWITDIEKLKNDFAGKKRSEIAPIISTYKSFKESDVSLSPFWKTKFPSDSSKIEVIIKE